MPKKMIDGFADICSAMLIIALLGLVLGGIGIALMSWILGP